MTSLDGDAISCTSGAAERFIVELPASDADADGIISLKFAIDALDTRLDDLRSGTAGLLDELVDVGLTEAGGTEERLLIFVELPTSSLSSAFFALAKSGSSSGTF